MCLTMLIASVASTMEGITPEMVTFVSATKSTEPTFNSFAAAVPALLVKSATVKRVRGLLGFTVLSVSLDVKFTVQFTAVGNADTVNTMYAHLTAQFSSAVSNGILTHTIQSRAASVNMTALGSISASVVPVISTAPVLLAFGTQQPTTAPTFVAAKESVNFEAVTGAAFGVTAGLCVVLMSVLTYTRQSITTSHNINPLRWVNSAFGLAIAVVTFASNITLCACLLADKGDLPIGAYLATAMLCVRSLYFVSGLITFAVCMNTYDLVISVVYNYQSLAFASVCLLFVTSDVVAYLPWSATKFTELMFGFPSLRSMQASLTVTCLVSMFMCILSVVAMIELSESEKGVDIGYVVSISKASIVASAVSTVYTLSMLVFVSFSASTKSENSVSVSRAADTQSSGTLPSSHRIELQKNKMNPVYLQVDTVNGRSSRTEDIHYTRQATTPRNATTPTINLNTPPMSPDKWSPYARTSNSFSGSHSAAYALSPTKLNDIDIRTLPPTRSPSRRSLSVEAGQSISEVNMKEFTKPRGCAVTVTYPDSVLLSQVQSRSLTSSASSPALRLSERNACRSQVSNDDSISSINKKSVSGGRASIATDRVTHKSSRRSLLLDKLESI
jgi:hypothetical protein